MAQQFKFENITRAINEGDAGLILGKDGKFFIFNTHAKIDVANMTEIQAAQADILEAFTVAMSIPAILQTLIQMAKDPAVVPPARALN